MQHLLHGQPGAIVGDCMRACIASLLELDAEQVPHFCENVEEEPWVHKTNEFLASLGFWWIEVSNINWGWLTRNIDHKLLMIGGKSPRGDWGHWVVGRVTRDGIEVVHDPHPSGDGLAGNPDGFGLIVKLFS